MNEPVDDAVDKDLTPLTLVLSREHLLLLVLSLVRLLVLPWSSLSTRKPSIRVEAYYWSPCPPPSPLNDWPIRNDLVERAADSNGACAAVVVVVETRLVVTDGDRRVK